MRRHLGPRGDPFGRCGSSVGPGRSGPDRRGILYDDPIVSRLLLLFFFATLRTYEV